MSKEFCTSGFGIGNFEEVVRTKILPLSVVPAGCFFHFGEDIYLKTAYLGDDCEPLCFAIVTGLRLEVDQDILVKLMSGTLTVTPRFDD
jgi:hypothetical protein